MQLSKEETLKHLLEDEELFVLYSASPDMKKMTDTKTPALAFRNPLLIEEPVTHRTQILIYDTGDACREAVKKYVAEKILCMSVRFQKESYRSLFLTMAEVGADSVVYHTGEDAGEVLLKEEKIQELIGLKTFSEDQRYLSRNLQLYWQQVNLNAMTPPDKVSVPAKQMEALRYNNFLGSMIHAQIIVPIVQDQQDPKKFVIPIRQQKTADGKNDEKQLLGFTTVLEVSRYFDGKMPQCRFFNMADIAAILKNHADILVLNPATSMCRMTAAVLERVQEDQGILKAVEDGSREPDERSVTLHLMTDRTFYGIYTASLHPVADGKDPMILIRNPYIHEDEETYNDQFRIFAEKEDALAFAKKIREEKKLYVVVNEVWNPNFQKLYTTLASKAVTSIVYNNKGKEFELDLSKMVKLPDNSNLEEKARPLQNPTLELSAQYYWQELTRAIPHDQRSEEDIEALNERLEEFLANLSKAEVYIRFIMDEKDGKKVQVIPMNVKKDAEGKIISAEYQLFTDIYELRAFYRENIPTIMKIPFSRLSDMLIDSCTGIVIDPAGVDLHFRKEVIPQILNM